MTDFKVSSATVVPDRNQIVLQGSIANGSVKAGMKVRVSTLAAEVSGVSMSMKDGRFEVGVILKFASSGDLTAWNALNVAPGHLLTLEETTSS